MSELDQLRQEAEQLKNQIRVRSLLVHCVSGQKLPLKGEWVAAEGDVIVPINADHRPRYVA
jgi:hypothetical protein